ncbi:MAG TPA: uracil-DNA glycosylase [Demequina sp.]|nr:uracil-DNA glycosylase [Demequina sp.]
MTRRSSHEGSPCRADDPSRPDFPAVAAPMAQSVADVDAAMVDCRACPRLVQWREGVAVAKRRAFRGWDYWGRPVPGLGPADARIVLVGLAPAAHGGNRTGRIFTGDPSGDVLYAALHAVGLASQPTSTHRGDGLEVRDVRITVPVHCAPPENQHHPVERATCRPWLVREMQLMRPTVRVAVALGGFAWQSLLPVLAETGWPIPRPRPKFGHGRYVVLAGHGVAPDLHLLGCYHPSQRNMSTRTLTVPMLEEVLHDAAVLAGL